MSIEYKGSYRDCAGGQNAFGGYGLASGTFKDCTGGNFAFGGQGTASGGRFYHCVGGDGAFTETGTPAPVHMFCVQNNAQYSGNN